MRRAKPLKHGQTVAATLRYNHGGKGLRLVSPFNDKSPKGEKAGYLTAMMYLAPHTLGGGKSLCPHSTEACRAGCLYTAGRGVTPRVQTARMWRTEFFLRDRAGFLGQLVDELDRMQGAADAHGLKLAIRLNGTSDVLWERERLSGGSIFELFPRATFYDYTRVPFEHRHVPPNWRLTFSLADEPLSVAARHLRAGRCVAVVAPESEKPAPGAFLDLWGREVAIIDGDDHDLRFLDPPGSVVLLKPKGRLRRGGPMVHSGFLAALTESARAG